MELYDFKARIGVEIRLAKSKTYLLQNPNHCNLVGRGSLYLRFETKAEGTLLIHSGGSVIDNLVAVYRDVSSYDALSTNLLGCATNNLRDVVTSVFGVPNPVEIPGVSAGQRFLVAGFNPVRFYRISSTPPP